jgi:acetyl/propionyl-CoA carboxylase alpha subunit
MFRRILIANRGEIAVRVIHACRELGAEAVAVYSDADAGALHVSLADRAVRIGPAPPRESYLAVDAIIAAALDSGADAIHPGYGFLSEHQALPLACERARIAFIGPPAEVITSMGSKITARRLAAEAGVPVVPGETPADQTDNGVADAARRVGFPLIVKPSEGGGGIGMKTVRADGELAAAVASARREALGAFGDGTLYVERLVERPRHVEFQVLADHHGGVVHLFERECSIQRRHQKVMEETPSPALTPDLRRRMGEAAVAVARRAGYRNAGTVEFLLDGVGGSATFYFLEMNTRLQVEHPITEEVTGCDLVRAQILVAAGEPLPWPQDAIAQRGHAFELRVYAEDPAHDFLPQAGRLLLYRQPSMPGVRVDAGVVEGDEITVHYDPLVAKLVAHAETRELARRRALEALRAFPILGIRTNIPVLVELLQHPRVVAGDLDTLLLEREMEFLRTRLDSGAEADAVAVAAAAGRSDSATAAVLRASDPWTRLRDARV